MQYLLPLGAGPSSKTCPRWLPHYKYIIKVVNDKN